MKIIADTREQIPLEFNHEFITEVKSMKLEVGDYACQYTNGFIPPVRFERKSIGDLFGTMGSGYERFKKEIERAKDYEVRLILIIEGSMFKVLKGYEPSSLKGSSVVKKLFTLWVRYNVMPVFCKDRDDMTNYITEFFLAIGRNTNFSKDIAQK